MYEAFFNLQRRPFSTTPDPSCVYLAGSIQTVVDELVVCLERGEGVAVLTAPAGFGKTLITEKVKRELGSEFVTVLLRHGNFSSPADLLRTLFAELGTSSATTSESDLRRHVIATLREMRQRGQLLVVICDEAHCLAEPVLEELRQLVDHADRGVSWVRLLLAGQLELEEKLADASLSALNQRLRSHVALTSLSSRDALDYIDYRITWAGGRTEEVFHPEALTAIVEAADGVPRCLNQLCDHVLLLAYVAEQRPAPPELVAEALSDLQHLPLTWNLRAVRQPTRTSFAVEEPTIGDPADEEPEVEFGSHFSESLSGGREAPDWGGNQGPHGPRSEPTELEEDAAYDPVGQFFDAVESELERIAPESAGGEESGGESDVYEEPVIDRYAAIDGGWPQEAIVPAETAQQTQAESEPPRSAAPVPMEDPLIMPEEQPNPVLNIDADEPEQRLQSDVLELVAATQDAIQTRRIDSANRSSREPLIEDDPLEAVETAPPRVISDRPFRNLFTRLRRKQKGLE